jgi:hypothetical protein
VFAPAQPAIFTVNQQGTGQAVATVGNTANVKDATHSVKAGDALVICCTGLGAVSSPVANGAAAVAAPLGQTALPNVTIGHKPAHVLFSGLSPGFVGLYQINLRVPSGVTPGDEVPVVIGIGEPPRMERENRGTRVSPITGVRANASALIVAGANQGPPAITSVISVSPPTALPIDNFGADVTVGLAAKGLISSVSYHHPLVPFAIGLL